MLKEDERTDSIEENVEEDDENLEEQVQKKLEEENEGENEEESEEPPSQENSYGEYLVQEVEEKKLSESARQTPKPEIRQTLAETLYNTASAHYQRILKDENGSIRNASQLSARFLSIIIIAALLYISVVAEVGVKVLPTRFEPWIRHVVPRPDKIVTKHEY